MAEPLATTASVIAVIGFAAESSKLVFQSFHQLAHAPVNVHNTYLALTSLHITLNHLQECGLKLNQSHKFPAHFQDRVNECLKDLKAFEAKIGEIDAVFGGERTSRRHWNDKTRRSLERLRWLLAGEQETRGFLDKVKVYQHEFFLELLILLININGAPTTQMLSPGPLLIAPASQASSLGLSMAPQLCPSSNHHVYPATEKSLPNQPSQMTADTQSPNGSVHCMNLSHSMGPCRDLGEDNISGSSKPGFLYPSIRAIFSHRWTCFLCDFAIQVGPTITPSTTINRTAEMSSHYRQVGVGLGFSLTLPKRCRRKLDIALYLAQESVRGRLKINLYWVIDCPRVIPRKSEIMHRVEEGSIDGVQRLLSVGRATARDLTIHGTTLLHLASKNNNLPLIRLLIQEGGDVNARDLDGDTPLHWALAREGKYEVARLLLENGADLANNANDKRTPLHTYFNDTIKKMLLRDDWIEETLPDSNGMSIAHYVAWSGKSTSKLFKRSVLYISTNLWAVDDFGRTCLHLAASRGNIDILGYLLERSSLTEVRRTDNEGRTALHYAVQNNRLKSVDLLIAKGADLHAKDNSSRNVLHYAARWGNLEAAQKLVALGDRKILSSPDKHGYVPSSLAPGGSATALSKFLTDLELAGSIEKNSNRQDSFYQSSGISLVPKVNTYTLSSRQLYASIPALTIILSLLWIIVNETINLPDRGRSSCEVERHS